MGIKGAGHSRALVAVTTVATLLGWAALFAYSAAASAAPRTGWATEAGRTARPAAGSSAYDWPELHLNAQLGGYAANGTVNTANAAGLGVRWATDLYGAILDSPVIAYDPASGRTLGYVGTDAGYFYAVDMATGAIAWADKLGGPIQPSPLVSDGAVWVGTRTSSTIYKLDASTGAIGCSHPVHAGVLLSSPVAATPPGGTASVYFAVSRSVGGANVLSLSAATCATQWSFSGYQVAAGTWDPLAYAVDAKGEPLVLFGSSDPDDAAYAVDAVTGAEVWRFRTTGTGDADVGSGLTISPPGANGIADGVAYVPGKDGFVFALDLTTGADLWTASLGSQGGVPNESLSTAALDGTDLVVGSAVGVSDFNAITGTLKWSYQTPDFSQITPPGPAEVISSPAISGPAGQEAVAFGDLSGAFRVLSLATGTQLYQYQTGSWISAGPAVSNGDILFGSSDGFLYDMSAGSGNQAPATAITSPARGATVANPGGTLTVSGTASDSTGVAAVIAAVRQGGSNGLWWNAATSTWSTAPVTERATLASPGATSSGWTISFPVPPSGNAYRVDAYAMAVDGPAAVPAADDEFFVRPAAGGPTLSLRHGSAAPGAKAWVNGTRFGPNEPVAITLLGKVIGQTTSMANGRIPATKVSVPPKAGFGPTALVATGATSSAAASVGIDITNNWPQAGGGPAHTGFEANDPIIQNTVDPGQQILLYPAWRFSPGAALTSPTVVDRVVYVGDQHGTLHALRARDGTQMWTWRTPTGAAITGAPAVDAATGLAFVGAADGTLYAVFTSGHSAGTLAWSAQVGAGNVQSPIFNGTTVYAASASGEVAALSKSTGSSVWSVPVKGGASAAPALDAAGQVLVVPTASGITALGAATGKSLWSFALPGPTSPMIAAGVVYIGSSNDDVYAVSESTGQQIWSRATGGAIQDSGALSEAANGSVTGLYIGSADGYLYFLNPATGAVLHRINLGASASGLVFSGNIILAAATGLAEGVRTFIEVVWSYDLGSGNMLPPAVVNGTFFVAGQQGTLQALTPYGAPPQ